MDSWSGHRDAARRLVQPGRRAGLRVRKAARTVINYLTEVDDSELRERASFSSREMPHEGCGYGWHGNDRP